MQGFDEKFFFSLGYADGWHAAKNRSTMNIECVKGGYRPGYLRGFNAARENKLYECRRAWAEYEKEKATLKSE